MIREFSDVDDRRTQTYDETVSADDSWSLSRNERLDAARANLSEVYKGTPDADTSFDELVGKPETSEWTSSQQELLDRDHDNATLDATPRNHVNEAYVMNYPDGKRAIYKPADGSYEISGEPRDFGREMRNEVAASCTDQVLGFNLVPPTVSIDGAYGPGSLQDWAPLEGRTSGSYDTIDQQKMGTLDYIIGSMDRHAGNVRTQGDLRPAAIDNGYCFPDNSSTPLRSGFFEVVLNRPLDQRIIDNVRNVDVGALTATLHRIGISEAGIAGVLARLNEVRSGKVTGEAWPGAITDVRWNTLKSATEGAN